MTNQDIDKLIDTYAWRCVNDMTLDDLRAFVAQSIAHDFESETDVVIIEQITSIYPDLSPND